MRVFVTDVKRRKSIPIIRALGKKEIEVTCGEASRLSMGAFSKYCSRFVVYPSTEIPELFIDFILNYLKQHPHDVIFPLDDATFSLCVQYKDVLSEYVHVPVPDIQAARIALDKSETMRFAKEHDIPCPRTYFIQSLRELKYLKKAITYPVVIKPRRSSGSRGIAYVHKQENLIWMYKETHKNYPYPIIQEMIPQGGDAFGVSVLFDQSSNPVATFVHKRLREYPITGGPSTLRISVKNPQLEEIGLALLKALNWYGVAMVEFKVDPRDGVPKLMEINPRFWGSVELPIVSGVDFPYLLCKVATGEKVPKISDYKVGVMCRWLLPGDILHFLSNPNRFKLNPSFFRFWSRDLHYDILSFDDFKPILGFFLASFGFLLDVHNWKSRFKIS